MTHQPQLTGNDLISCAQANAKAGLAIAAQQCGYKEDFAGFLEALEVACVGVGIEVQELINLLTHEYQMPKKGIKIAPKSFDQL